MPTAANAVKIIIGMGAFCSATIGANIDKTLAKKLQNPKAVEQNKVGNTFTVEQYTRTKPPVIPNLVITTKMGIRSNRDSPTKIIVNPPITDIANKRVNDFLIPKLPYK